MERRPIRGGAVHCGEQHVHTTNRQILQGNAAMRMRLSALIWSRGLRDAPGQNDTSLWGART